MTISKFSFMQVSNCNSPFGKAIYLHFFIRQTNLLALHTGKQPTCTSYGKATYLHFTRESNLLALHTGKQPTCTSSFGKPTYLHFIRESNLLELHTRKQLTCTSSFGKATYLHFFWGSNLPANFQFAPYSFKSRI
jgi:hypothetical protein